MLNGKSVLITRGSASFGHTFFPMTFMYCSDNNKEWIKENKEKVWSF
jgi:hypothetical protein